MEEGGFIGADVICAEGAKKIKDIARRRVGLIVEGPPAREGAIIQDENGVEIGKRTFFLKYAPLLHLVLNNSSFNVSSSYKLSSFFALNSEFALDSR